MKNLKLLPIFYVLTLLFFSAACGVAYAVTIYSQTPVVERGLQSDTNIGSAGSYVQVAEDFVLSSDEVVKKVIWRGYTFEGSDTVMDFTIDFFTDTNGINGNSGHPGELITSYHIGNNVTRIDTGIEISPNPPANIIEYSAELGEGLSLTAGNYWISIYNTSASGIPFELVSRTWSGKVLRKMNDSLPFTHIHPDETYLILDNGISSIQVLIDIKPNDEDVVTINLKKDKHLKVAILTQGAFDAVEVDPATVQFGPASAWPSRYQETDADGDGDIDLLLIFKTNDTGISCGDLEATLTGMTFNGQDVVGVDSFTVTGC